MRTVHDRSCQAPDWELWVRKGFAKESVHSLRFSYQFTEEDRKLEAQLLEGKEDAERERIQRNIVNERDTILFDTAWSNPEPVIMKLAEMYPDAEIEHWWADENIGYNTGHRVIRNGEEQVEYFDGDRNAYEIYQMCWGESDCVYLDENDTLQSRDCDTCAGCK